MLVKSSCDSAEELWPLCKAAIYSADNMQCRLSSAVLPTGRKGRPLQQAGLHPVSLRECAIRELITVKNIPLLSKSTPFLCCLLLCIQEEKRTSSNLLSLPGLVYTPFKGSRAFIFFPHNNEVQQHSLGADTSD